MKTIARIVLMLGAMAIFSWLAARGEADNSLPFRLAAVAMATAIMGLAYRWTRQAVVRRREEQLIRHDEWKEGRPMATYLPKEREASRPDGATVH